MRNAIAKLLGKPATIELDPQETVQELPLTELVANQFQPRTVFDGDRIEELAVTIEEHGLLQPIVVRKQGTGYEIIAGERRYRAVRSLGWETIPAIVKEMTDETTASLALIENLQREDLTPIEEAEAYERLLALQDITQEVLARKLGRSQSTIANKLRLLRLPTDVREALKQRTITERHARALLPLKDEALQVTVLAEILEREWNVKETERRVERLMTPQPPKKKRHKSFARDTRIALNTLRDSVDMIEQTGLTIEKEEVDCEEYVEVRIRIVKARPE
ncbi:MULTISPECIES: nucleoid occlusion protein [unclassified Exiguobacterium]|uniref:Probable chromosome-partitioning protein ParB n=1 Tax=Salmonella enteritidis PT4 (strain P125109) TaxID=550537 RepID=A0A724X0Y5_SALEP|nr:MULTISPECIES: nucleoid occlusion protein [unclassified Exiguobacterium]HAE0521257.1 nucleoid occlusion protein [Salmonella enterica subsp. enterica serovar Enteritidis str. P125109]HBF58038.1 nucleoid occlusion protein [Exiguobacterium sp.]HCV54391.1 nucleoid occlusion protein [Exiguobacterium sp.]